jgi:hypothetical protein
MSRLFKLSIAVLLCLLMAITAYGNAGFQDLSDLPPGEQYRQLSLILLISDGASSELVKLLEPQAAKNEGRAGSSFNPDDYKTPLIRIVDQGSMLAGAAFLLGYAQGSTEEIKASLAAIDTGNPVLISMVDMNAITEDAIIIRNAIADSIAYSNLADTEEMAAYLNDYQVHTIRIRNVMEYELFNTELERLTAEAILSVGGKLDAYQRMFDEEVDSKEFDRQFDAANYIFNRTEKFDEKAGKLTEEIMKNVIFSQSQPDP